MTAGPAYTPEPVPETLPAAVPEPGPGVASAGPVPPLFVALQPDAATPSSSPPPSTDQPDTEPEPEPTVVTFAFSGDILPHSPLWDGAARNAAASGTAGFDFDPMLAALSPLHDRADLAVCHLETPIAPVGEPFSTMPYYGVPAEIADAIAAAGFDRCSTASNHTFDRGVAGIERTITELERVGVAQDGMARTITEVAPRVFDVDGVAIAHLSYTYSYNGIIPRPDDAWRSRLIDPDRILSDAAEARRVGAELVILSLHWGAEGRSEPTDEQRRLADRLTASGLVDLIVGHHAHVVQPIEQVNGVWVIYGMGNLLSNMPTGTFPPASQDGVVVSIAVHRDTAGRFTWLPPAATPTWVDRDDGWQIRILADELAGDALGPGRRSVLQASYDRTAAVVGEYVATGSATGGN
ncbi:MAG TPA: CapA family protein [Ilumatobacter sp.]|nr:CapA family protein [Ilumatobacter sp.]